MPTNVTPEYRKAEERYRQARTTEEKLERLQDMISLLPKHKGTEHLHADLKRRLSRLKDQEEKGTKAGGGGPDQHIERSGAAQVVVLGPPNSGKSSLIAAMTNAPVEVADYPFSTTQMQPAMLDYRDVQIQLVDTPPVTADFMPVHLFGIVRSADAVLITVDLGNDDLIDDYRTILTAFSTRSVRFVSRPEEDRDAVFSRIIGTKADSVDADVRLALFREACGVDLDVHPFIATSPEHREAFAQMLFGWLGIIRVYTKSPNAREPEGRPFALFEGDTVEELCRHIHRDLADRFQHARMWRRSDTPVTVSRNQVLEDGDVVEIHAQGG